MVQDDQQIPAHCIAVHAEYLGMDPMEDTNYVYIAEEALRAPLPDVSKPHAITLL
jgi:hypothetical protein